MIKPTLFAGVAALLTACAAPPQKAEPPQGAVTGPTVQSSPLQPVRFSADGGAGEPKGWEPLVILRTKNPTNYKLVRENGHTVLHAKAVNASSGLISKVQMDPVAMPWLHWRWKIKSLIQGADNQLQAKEDSPVRIILGFDGDKDALPFKDQMMFETAKMLTGHEMPYATLMYIWENRLPVGTVIPSVRSSRVKMIVAASGPEGLGQWRDFHRNIVEDFQKAFGEQPGQLVGIGVLTDTDNTGETVEAWYGDIQLRDEPAS
ncbi:Protein of unknown function [Noviherbaspirillum humi]|uniref:DUF3047 domain-containing protein n=1 Tax=Noviherbaspirillum humi TaxID=1688639 RepID=A0A239LBS6_9BURK|nr:DUF3047 domain-containing protein [Noviherbaspirillum humi]SNT26994.1 Protein of unknown function [Noviherbaspirillum humi]